MNSSHDDGNFAGAMFIGAGILTLALGSIMLKTLKTVFKELSRTFDAFGKMAHSFFEMLWEVGLVVLTIASTVAVVVAAVYFTKQFIQLVKSSFELREAFEIKRMELEASVRESHRKIRREVDSRLEWMESRLDEALKEPEIAPEVKEVSALLEASPSELLSPLNEETKTENGGQDTEGDKNESADTTPVSMNPF